MRIAIAAAAACLVVLAGCQSDDPASDPTPVDSLPGEPTEEPTETTPGGESLTAADVAGSWTSDEGSEMTLNLTAEGTYTLDVIEEEISSGTFEVDGTTITFIEGEADGLTGTVEGDRLVTTTATYVKQ